MQKNKKAFKVYEGENKECSIKFKKPYRINWLCTNNNGEKDDSGDMIIQDFSSLNIHKIIEYDLATATPEALKAATLKNTKTLIRKYAGRNCRFIKCFYEDTTCLAIFEMVVPKNDIISISVNWNNSQDREDYFLSSGSFK